MKQNQTKLQTQKASSLVSYNGIFKEQVSVLHNLFHITEENGILPKSFCEGITCASDQLALL